MKTRLRFPVASLESVRLRSFIVPVSNFIALGRLKIRNLPESHRK